MTTKELIDYEMSFFRSSLEEAISPYINVITTYKERFLKNIGPSWTEYTYKGQCFLRVDDPSIKELEVDYQKKHFILCGKLTKFPVKELEELRELLSR